MYDVYRLNGIRNLTYYVSFSFWSYERFLFVVVLRKNSGHIGTKALDIQPTQSMSYEHFATIKSHAIISK